MLSDPCDLTFQRLIAIVSMLLLLTTFAVGLKCFLDFDKGLYDSKASSGQLFPRCLYFLCRASSPCD